MYINTVVTLINFPKNKIFDMSNVDKTQKRRTWTKLRKEDMIFSYFDYQSEELTK